MSARHELVARMAARNPLPEGTISVGVGLAVAGVCTYGFLAIAARALGPVQYTPLASFWSLLFVLGPGVFYPLEQEVGRALGARRAHHQGGGPLVRRAGAAGCLMVLVLVAITGALTAPIGDHLFGGELTLVAALLAGLVAYFAEHLSRGTLSGNARFTAYGVLLGGEGVYRVILCACLAAAGVRSPAAYAAVIVVGSFLAVATALIGRRGLLRHGPPAPWSELSAALGYLLAASLVTQFLLNGGTFIVQLLSGPGEEAAAGRFLTGRVIAYVPLFLFQAVAAALLPKLSTLHGRGRHADFRRALIRLLTLVAVLGTATTLGALLLGPFIVKLLFGEGFDLNRSDLALLAAGCGVFMAAQVLTPALIALGDHARVATGWAAGAVAFVVVIAVVRNLFLRVELGLIAAGVGAALVMGAFMLPVLRPGTEGPSVEDLVAAGSPPAIDT